MSKEGKKDEKVPENEKAQEDVDLAAEFAALGRKFGEAMKTAWQSEERHKIQQELRDGLERFVGEVDQAAKKLRESDVGVKVEEGVKQAHTNVKSGKVGQDVRRGLVSALRTIGDALDKMADSFTGVEEKPKE